MKVSRSTAVSKTRAPVSADIKKLKKAPELHIRVKKGSEEALKNIGAHEAEVRNNALEISKEEQLQKQQDLSPWATEEHLSQCIETFGKEKVDLAIDAAKHIWKLSRHLGLIKPELFELALYIETKLPKKVEDGKIYLKKEKTGLARTIEYDPKSKQIFIHLKTHGIDRLGKGWHKKVTKSIMYDVKKPELVANSTFMDDGKEEVASVKKLKNLPGLAHTYAITEHKKEKSGQVVISIIQRLYNGGNLLPFLHNETSLSKKDVMLVARDLMQGLESMHDKEMVHRDLHGGNFLLERHKDEKTGKEVVSCVIIDLGQAKEAAEAKKEAPKVQIPHRFNPPEAFWRDKTWIDTKKIDVYAVGLNVYNLYFKTTASWAVKDTFSKIPHLSDDQKLKFRKNLSDKMEKSLAKQQKKLDKKHNLSVYDRFAKLILQMLHPDQNKRHSAAYFRHEIEALVKK